MAYEGLNRYRFDDVARQYAEKSYNLFMDDWKTNQHTNENYYAWGGTGGGDPHYTWGALLALTAVEQYIDMNPWEGLRFGSLSPAASGEFRGARWENHSYDVTIGPEKTTLTRDGALRFEANAGVVVREYQATAHQVSFACASARPIRVASAEFEAGELALKVNGKFVKKVTISGGRATFDLPSGQHRVELERLAP
jgi:hypothetical protein